jgi:hypothetical protein
MGFVVLWITPIPLRGSAITKLEKSLIHSSFEINHFVLVVELAYLEICEPLAPGQKFLTPL